MSLLKLKLLKLINKDFRAFQSQTGWIFEDGFQEIKSFHKGGPEPLSEEFIKIFPVVYESIRNSKILVINAEFRTYKLYSWKKKKRNFGLMFAKGGYENCQDPSNHLELFNSQLGAYEGVFNSPISFFSNTRGPFLINLATVSRINSRAVSKIYFDHYLGSENLNTYENWISISHSNELLYNTTTNQLLIKETLRKNGNVTFESCSTLSNLLNELFINFNC